MEVKEAFAKQHAALRDAERDADAARTREAEERGRAHAQEQESRYDVRTTTDPEQQATQSLSGPSIHQERQPTHQATSVQSATIRIVHQSDKPEGGFRWVV